MRVRRCDMTRRQYRKYEHRCREWPKRDGYSDLLDRRRSRHATHRVVIDGILEVGYLTPQEQEELAVARKLDEEAFEESMMADMDQEKEFESEWEHEREVLEFFLRELIDELRPHFTN